MPKPPKRKPKRLPPSEDLLDWKAVHRAVAFLEKAKLADYVDLLNSPWRSMWLHFLAGLARGAGIVVGTVLIGSLVVLLTLQSLRYVAKHSDMVPWFGDQVREAVGFVLEAANEKLEGGVIEEGK